MDYESNLLLQLLEDINCNQISYNDINDQTRFLQENVKFLYEANVSKRTTCVTANQITLRD